jgi:hypothetical protein
MLMHSPSRRRSKPTSNRDERRRAQKRDCYHRSRAGLIMAKEVVVGADELDALVALKWLRDEEAHDAAAVGRALSALIRDVARHRFGHV